MRILIAGCGVESLLVYSKGLELGLDVSLPDDCHSPHTEGFDAIISMGTRCPGNNCFPPAHSIERARVWREIAQCMGIESGNPDGGESIHMLVARSRRGEIKTYPPVVERHLDRHLYCETYNPKKEILWRLWDMATIMAQEVGFVGLVQMSFTLSDKPVLTDFRLNTFDRTWLLLDASLTPPTEQILRSIMTGFLGETTITVPAAGFKSQIEPQEKEHLFLKLTSIEGSRIRIPDGKTLLLSIMDAMEDRRRKKIERALKIILGRGRKPPTGFP